MGTDVERVVEHELALLTASVRRSALEVEQLLDPGFREIGASGRLWTRTETIAALAAESAGPAVTVSEMQGVVLGSDLILLTYVSDRQGRRARRSSLWRRSDGSWRLLHHQGTVISAEFPQLGL